MTEEQAVRAARRRLVRAGYDAISEAYRSDDGGPDPSSSEDTARYDLWVDVLARAVPAGSRILDLGCGAGVPATRLMVDNGFQVVGVDFSAVQLRRARHLVPGAALVQADMAELHLSAGSVDAVVSFYAFIHLPLRDQEDLFGRIHDWLRPGGRLLAIVGAERWTGVEPYLGADMFWDHADTGTYRRLLTERRLTPLWTRFIPEGDSGHTLVMATAE